jgi:hypothetical protein
MLRRWLAALHSLDAEDEAVAARLHEARSPPSEEATVEAKQIAIPGADARSAPDAEEEKNIPDAPAAPAAEASSSPPGSPSDPDAEWADVQMPAHGRTVAPAIVAAADDRVSIDVVVDAANVASASVLRFRSERAKISSLGDKGDDDDESDVFDFRDVLLRSRCLENLVASFAHEPAADDDEARLFLKLVDALVWDASSEKSPDETSEPGVDSRISASLVACVARAGAALRDPKRTAEVQLGDDALVAMLSAGAGSVKKIGAAETLLRRERRLRRALEANAGAVRLLSHEASASSSRGALPAGREKTSVSGAEGSTDSTNAPSPTRSSLEGEIRRTRSADDETSDVKKIVVEKNADDVVRAVTPTSTLAAATRLGVDLSRRAHDHAAARALRLAAESELAPTEDALVRCRASLETLAHASTDVAGLSEQSRARLLEAERFRETKLRECVEAETKKRDDAAAAEKRRADAAAALAAAELEASRASEEAERATAERVAFEESAEAVRETLERKVRDLHDRAEEYKAESRAIGVVRDALREIARARARFLEAASAAAADDVASARSRYVEAAKAHGEGQAGAARLCLARLRFCKKELEETRRKRAEASALGIRGGGGDGDSARLGDVVTSTERGSLSADLRAAQRSIERAYVEAEEGAKAVFAAAEASRREATAIAPTAFCSKAESGGSRKGDPPTIDLATVFCAIDDARAAFAAEAATRPVLEIEETRNEDDDDGDGDEKNDSSSETPETHAETPKKEKRETESRRVSSSPSEETAATDPPPEPESSSYAPPESEPSSEPVPPAAEDPREDLREPRVASDSDAPPKEKSSARVTTERATEPSVEPTGDDIDDWLSDD